jgi:hypothetical protein
MRRAWLLVAIGVMVGAATTVPGSPSPVDTGSQVTPTTSQPPSPTSGPVGGSEQKPPTDRQQQARPDQRGTDQSPLVVKVQTPPKSQREAEQDADYQERSIADQRMFKLDVWAIIIGVAQTTALVITFMVIAFVGIRQLRAYLTVSPIFLVSFDEHTKPVVRFKISNVGSTPAYKLRFRAQIGIMAHPPKGGMSLKPITGSFSPELALHPGGEPLFMAHQAEQKFGVEEIKRIQEATVRIYLYGEVRYRDTFYRWRHTQFCHSVNETGVTIERITTAYEGTIPDVHFELAPMGNKAT